MNLKVLITQAFMPHSMAAIKPPVLPNPEHAKFQVWYEETTAFWNSPALKQLLKLVALATKNPDLETFVPNSSNGPVYDPLTILSVNRQHASFHKNELIIVTQGIDRYALNRDGVEDYYSTADIRPASDIEVLAFYGSMTAPLMKQLAFDSRFAHISDQLFNPAIEVVEEPVPPEPIPAIHQV